MLLVSSLASKDVKCMMMLDKSITACKQGWINPSYFFFPKKVWVPQFGYLTVLVVTELEPNITQWL